MIADAAQVLLVMAVLDREQAIGFEFTSIWV
jgi:hypothetical protein